MALLSYLFVFKHVSHSYHPAYDLVIVNLLLNFGSVLFAFV